MGMGEGSRVLYVAYWGAAEPLGQSLILPAIAKLSERGARLALLTFEKPGDLERTDVIDRLKERLAQRGVAWRRLRYHKWPRVPATAFDMVNGWFHGVAEGRRLHADIVHGRTFVGGLIGWAIATTLRVPFVYHNEGFYPDEMVDGGFWSQDSLPHRVAKRLERLLYDSAAGLVALSTRAARVLESLPSVQSRRTPVIVVPSCVDLERFTWDGNQRPPRQPLRFVYIGAVGGRYELDRIGRFLAVLHQLTPVRLRVLSREPMEIVAGLLRAGGLDDGLWDLAFVPHSDVAAELTRSDVGLFFLTRGLSEQGCSPTKIGEYWACGLPVVSTANVSDTDELVARFGAGVILSKHTDVAYQEAGERLLRLLADPGLAARCRAAAETHYNLNAACDRQLGLYVQVARS
jgi:glycosyltransferase involved in cell wall biosynthesis